jgi:hypothetical protein
LEIAIRRKYDDTPRDGEFEGGEETIERLLTFFPLPESPSLSA